MKHPSLSLFATTIVFGLVAACATSSDSTDIPEPDSGPTLDAAKDTGKPLDAGHDSADANTCPSQCASDNDCQSACASIAMGIWCCDTQTAQCYQESSSVCPAPPDGSPGD